MSKLILPGKETFISPDPQELLTATSVTSEIAAAVSTHAGLSDPHTGYRLESADHTHQSTGLQGGTLDHGLALVGLADDDHTQYHTAARHSAFHAYLRGERVTSNQSINDNTATTVIYNSLVVEDDPDDAIDLNTSTGVVTINTAGLYLFSASVGFDNTASAYLRQFLRLFHNGATQVAGQDGWARGAAANGGVNIQVSAPYKCAASDTMEAQVIQDNTGNTAQNVLLGTNSALHVIRMA